MRTLLIDGDILVVSTGFSCEREVDWGDDEWSLHVDLKEVKESILTSIDWLQRELDADAYKICLSRGETFRHRLSPSYKAGRGRKPVGTNAVKDWLVEEHGAVLKPDIEADDIMGIYATHPRLIKGETVIVSSDKDMLTIPGQLYREGSLMEVTEGEARYNWLCQTLTGDSTDGYPGVPGIGPTKARKILDAIDFQDPGWWKEIEKVFISNGLSEEDALLQARLARILHASDYDFKKKEVRLWVPQ